MKKIKLTEFIFAVCFIILSASFLNAEEYSGEANSAIYIKQGIFCPNEYNHTRWIDTFTGESYPTINADPIFDCRDFQDIKGDFAGENSCCPRIGNTFTTCQLVSSSEYSVELLPLVTGVDDRYTCLISSIRSCSNYTTQEECQSSSTVDIAEYTIESNDLYGEGWCNKPIDSPWEDNGKICSNFTSCNCLWNASESKCLANAEKYWECDDGSKNTFNFCQYFLSIDDSQCSEPNGMIIKTWDVINPSGDPNCAAGTEEEPCVDITRLNFFTPLSFIAVIIVLIAIYLYWFKRTGKNKK